MLRDKRDLAHFLSIDCPHCALSEFLILWEEHHPDTDAKKVLGSILEMAADFIVDGPSHEERCHAVIFATNTLKKWLTEIVEQRYKVNSETVEIGDSIKRSRGGLH